MRITAARKILPEATPRAIGHAGKGLWHVRARAAAVIAMACIISNGAESHVKTGEKQYAGGQTADFLTLIPHQSVADLELAGRRS